MASEASVAEPTTDGMGEKKSADDVKIVEEDNASSLPEETGESGGAERPNVEEQASCETVRADPKKTTEVNKDGEPAVESSGKKKEDEVEEAAVCGILEDDKDVALAPTVDDVNKENEEAKACSSEAEVNKEHTAAAVAEVVKEGAETDRTLITDELKIEASEEEPEPEGSTEDKKKDEGSAAAAESGKKEEGVHEAPASSGVLEDDMDAAPTNTIDEVKKEDEEEKASSSQAAGKEEEHTAFVTDQKDVVKDEEAETGVENSHLDEPETQASGKEPAEKSTVTTESLSEPAVQEPLADHSEGSSEDPGAAAPAPAGDVGAGGCTEETKNNTESGQAASESVAKEAEADNRAHKTSSTTVGESEMKIDDTDPVTESDEIPVKSDVDVEEQREEKTAVTEAVEECKQVETAEKEPAQVVVSLEKDEKPPEATEKDVAEEGEKELTDETVKEEEYTNVVVQASIKDVVVVVEGTQEADISIKQPASTEKEEGDDEEKIGECLETEKTDAQQSLDESSNKDSAGSKTVAGVQKPEAPAKPKTLISKVKHSIVKVKKAIIGKSPSSKTMSAEVDEVKTTK